MYPTIECTTWTQCKTVGSMYSIIIVQYVVAYYNRVIESYARIQAWYVSDTPKTGQDSGNTSRFIHPICFVFISLSLSLSFSLSLDVSPREVFHHGSLPAKYLFTWVSACSAVLEHSSSAGKEVLVEHLKANNDDDEESITSY